MHHELKIHPKYYARVVSGDKTFEIRNAEDRDFQTGDRVTLIEFDQTSDYSGRSMEMVITYVTDYMQMPGYVVFGITPTESENADG